MDGVIGKSEFECFVMINESRGTVIIPRKLRKFILPARFTSWCKRFTLSPGGFSFHLEPWRVS